MKLPRNLIEFAHLGVACILLLPTLSSAQSEGDDKNKVTPVPLSESIREKSPSRPEIKHLNQGNSRYCAMASCLMAMQVDTGLELEDERLFQQLGGLITARYQAGKSGMRIHYILEAMGMKYHHRDFAEENRTMEKSEAETLALKLLKDVVIPTLSAGNFVTLTVGNNSLGHVLLLTKYQESTKTFVIHDAVKNGPSTISVEEMAKRWPFIFPEWYVKKTSSVEEGFYLRFEQIKINGSHKALRKVPEACELDLEYKMFPSLKDLKQVPIDLKSIEESIPDVRWIHASKWWEEGRNLDEIPGVATLSKIKVAEGNPLLTLFSKGDGSLMVGAVTGYRGGLCNPDGEIQITAVTSGEVFSKWMSSKEFTRSVCNKDKAGKVRVYFGFPEKSLVK